MNRLESLYAELETVEKELSRLIKRDKSFESADRNVLIKRSTILKNKINQEIQKDYIRSADKEKDK